MAERRMFAKTIVLSDAFLDMSLGARCLYMTLGMVADDDGFVNNPKSIMRQCGASEDDLKILFAKRFLIPFDSGVVVIKHWRINNYLQKDRYNETKYLEEKAKLIIGENGAYSEADQMDTHTVYTQDRLGKDSTGKDRLNTGADAPKSTKFARPSLEEVSAYCAERNNGVDAGRFVDHYEAVGWKVGKAPMKDWKAAVRTWEKYESQKSNGQAVSGNKAKNFLRQNAQFQPATEDDYVFPDKL